MKSLSRENTKRMVAVKTGKYGNRGREVQGIVKTMNGYKVSPDKRTEE
jgi:hypothetical protein